MPGEFLTVAELAEALAEHIKLGRGDKLVLIEDVTMPLICRRIKFTSTTDFNTGDTVLQDCVVLTQEV
jgi:hypothetical protein